MVALAERDTLATEPFEMTGAGARSPVRTRSPSALASCEIWLLSLDAVEIFASSASLLLLSCWSRPAYCASARLAASAAMSIPEPAPSAEMIEDAGEFEVEAVVVIRARTVARA